MPAVNPYFDTFSDGATVCSPSSPDNNPITVEIDMNAISCIDDPPFKASRKIVFTQNTNKNLLAAPPGDRSFQPSTAGDSSMNPKKKPSKKQSLFQYRASCS